MKFRHVMSFTVGLDSLLSVEVNVCRSAPPQGREDLAGRKIYAVLLKNLECRDCVSATDSTADFHLGGNEANKIFIDRPAC